MFTTEGDCKKVTPIGEKWKEQQLRYDFSFLFYLSSKVDPERIL